MPLGLGKGRVRGCCTLKAGFWLGLDTTQWCLIILAMGLVWMAELSNTAIESAVDLASPAYHPLAKIAKDVKAAVVVMAALAAFLVGVLILGPALAIKLGWISH